MPGLLAAATVATSLFRPIPEMESNSANKFFDALAAGRPVAINYGGWHRELLAGAAPASRWPPRPAAAAEQLAAFLADADRLTRAGAAARRLAETRFDRDVLAAEFASVLERVARTGRGQRGLMGFACPLRARPGALGRWAGSQGSPGPTVQDPACRSDRPHRNGLAQQACR